MAYYFYDYCHERLSLEMAQLFVCAQRQHFLKLEHHVDCGVLVSLLSSCPERGSNGILSGLGGTGNGDVFINQRVRPVLYINMQTRC